MSKFTFRPAIRDSHTPLLIGLVGPSGGGKTYSALRLAKGIQSVRGGKIAYIDTEAKRALHYAEEFDFLHSSFAPPFSSVRYMESLVDAAKASEGGVVVVDSMSHEHEGEGGYLECHESELERFAGNDWEKRKKMTFLAWQKPSGERRRLINKLLQIECVFIFCFRAKEKLKLITGGKPVPLGWQAIAGEEFSFEMTVRCLLPPGANGVPDWGTGAFEHHVAKRPNMFSNVFKNGRQLDEDVGKEMATWAAGPATEKKEKLPTKKEGGVLSLREQLEADISDSLDGLNDEQIISKVIEELKKLSSVQEQQKAVYKHSGNEKLTDLSGKKLKDAAIQILSDSEDMK